jgi:hypothetical protein
MSNALAKYRRRNSGGQAGPIAFGMTTHQGQAQTQNLLTTQRAAARVQTTPNMTTLAGIAKYAKASRRGVGDIVQGAESNFGGALSHYITQQTGPARAVAGATVGEVKAGIKAADALQQAYAERISGIGAGKSAAMGSIGYEKNKTLEARAKERLKLTQEQEYDWLKDRQEQQDKMAYLRAEYRLSNGGDASGTAGKAFSSAAGDLQNALLATNSDGTPTYTPAQSANLVNSLAYQYNLGPQAQQQLRDQAAAAHGAQMSLDSADMASISQTAQRMAQENKQGHIGALGDQNIMDALGVAGGPGNWSVNGTPVSDGYVQQAVAAFKKSYTGKLA